MVCGGATGTGKTVFALDIVRHARRCVYPVPRNFLIAYSEWQPLYDALKKVVPAARFSKGLPATVPNDSLLIVDDLIRDGCGAVADLFTKGSHHRRISVVFITQNIFLQESHYRLISLNAQYIALFKSPRDVVQPMTLGRQIFPGGKLHAFRRAYELATQSPFGYLFVDVKTTCPEELRMRGDVLSPTGQTVYVPIESSGELTTKRH